MKKILLLLVFFVTFVNAAVLSPYLQTATDHSIIINWENTIEEDGTVYYGLNENLGNSIKAVSEKIEDGVYWYTVELSELSANTQYYYQVKTSSGQTDIFKFTTYPEIENSDGHLRFLVRSDNQTDYTTGTKIINAMEEKLVELYGEDYQKDINFMFDVGDIVGVGSDLSAYQQEYFEPIAKVSTSIPAMVSIGNHEAESAYYYQYMKYDDFAGAEGEAYYSYQCGKVLVISLNSNVSWRNDTQIEWLDQKLAEAENDDDIDWVFTFCHHPPYSCVWTPGDTPYVSDRVIPVLNKYSKATFLVNGHTHAYERGSDNDENLRLMVVGGAGGHLDRWADNNYENYTQHHLAFDYYHWVLFDVDVQNRSCTVETYGMGNPDRELYNTKIDSFTHYLEPLQNAPEKPVLVAQSDSLELPVTLEANEFAGLSSQIQVSDDEDFGDTVLDVKRDFEDWFLDTGYPYYNPINQNEDIELNTYELTVDDLPYSGIYYWRIRYRDFDLQWSEWSETEKLIVTETGYQPPKAYNKSMAFNGSKGYLEIDDNISEREMPKRAMTVETWVKLSSHNTWGGYIGAFQDNGSYERGWVLGNYGQRFSFALATKSMESMTYLSGGDNFKYDKWYHVAGVYDDKFMYLYVNGILIDTTNVQNGDIYYDDDSFFDIGVYHDDNEEFVLDGQMDETRLWNVALSQQEIQAWMHKEVNEEHPEYENLISCWSYNDLNASVISDLTGENNAQFIEMTPIQIKNSSAPLGIEGELLKDTQKVILDAIKVSANATPDDDNYLGVYAITDSTEIGELPTGVTNRIAKILGICEFGNISADIIINYNGYDLDELYLLKRDDVNDNWSNITAQASIDTVTQNIFLNNQYKFGEYSIGYNSGGVTAVKETETATKFKLYNNYPNPFNPATVITYELPEQSKISVVIYDIRGSKVATLVKNQTVNAGSHEVVWNGKNDDGFQAANGIYFCQLKSNMGNKIIKMTLNK